MNSESGVNPNYVHEMEFDKHSGDSSSSNDSHSHSHSHGHDDHGHSHNNDNHHGHSHNNDDHHGHDEVPNTKFRITKTNSLVFMHILVGCFFLVELVVGHITKSTALIADSFHMLSDVISLVIALVAVKMSDKASTRNTFGWVRAEVYGSLVNSVFLLALCFSITIEAINRFVEPKEIQEVDKMLIVGGVGLFINLAGLAVFGMHDHEHGHGHSHGGGHGHAHNNKVKEKLQNNIQQLESITVDVYTVQSDTTPINNDCGDDKEKKQKKKKKSSRNMNMRGVFLHVLSDALGALAVIISGLIIKYVPPAGQQHGWKLYVDPILSLLITILIVSSTVPLFIEASLVLLQTVPSQFDIQDLKKLVSSVPGVLDVHHFHVWGLNSEKVVASAHLKIHRQTASDEFKIIEDVKSLLHDCDIHATTLQLEYDDDKPPGYNYDYCKGNECRKRQCCIVDDENAPK